MASTRRSGPRANPEEAIVREALAVHGSDPGVVLLRNVVKTVPNPWVPGALLTFGLGEGTPDVVGSVVCPCPTCGTPGARPLGLEFKTPVGRAKDHQRAVHEAWRSQGWLVEIVRSVDAVGDVLDRARRGR